MSMVSVYAVFASVEEARAIGRRVIEERLAACINIIGPVTSLYRWQDNLEETEEIAAFLKTSSKAVDRLIARVAELHSYDVPCIAALPVDKALATYASWVEDNLE